LLLLLELLLSGWEGSVEGEAWGIDEGVVDGFELEEFVREERVPLNSAIRVNLKHMSDEGLGIEGADKVIEGEFGLDDLFQDEVNFFIIIRVLPKEHVVENDTKRPDVNSGVIWVTLQHLRSHSDWGTTLSGRAFVGGGKPKVSHFHPMILIQQHVLQLNVSMCDANWLQVVQSRDNVPHVTDGILLTESLLTLPGLHLVEVATTTILSHKVVGVLWLNLLVATNYVRVVQSLNDSSLIL
jgi:hypothetical protein